MLWTIGVLAVGAIFAGLLEIPGVTHGMRDFLAPSIPRAVEATGGQELVHVGARPSGSRSRASASRG